jgi:uroporphyrinogen-III synthase
MSDSCNVDLPLRNRTVVGAASPEKADRLKDGLEQLGADVLPAQASLIRGVQDTAPLDIALRNLGQYRWILFTSPSNVRNFVNARGERTGKRILSASTVAALGPVTAAAILSYGREAEIRPGENTLVSLLEAVRRYYGSSAGSSPVESRAG